MSITIILTSVLGIFVYLFISKNRQNRSLLNQLASVTSVKEDLETKYIKDIKYEEIGKILDLFDFYLKKLHDIRTELYELAGKEIICGICMISKNDTVLNPCGHMCCQNCANRIHPQLCPFCRKTFTNLIKTYQ